MREISREYAILFNGITETVEELELLSRKVKMYQQMAEEYFITENESEGVKEKIAELV